MLMTAKDNPGVFIPPPLIYAAFFGASGYLQKRLPIGGSFFDNPWSRTGSVLLLMAALYILSRSLVQFIRTKNTVITVRAASSLQKTGIYRLTRNPMYLGLALIYLGLACLIGKWWNILLFPLLLLTVQEFVIRREEKYLTRRFGREYDEYRNAVRRWL